MAQDKSTDILMMFVLGGGPIAAECTTEFRYEKETPELLHGFEPGRFFELDEISLGLDKAQSTSAAGGAKQGAATDISDITISRRIDQASLTLMECCFTAKTLKSASIVKRRGAGTGRSGEPYLRLDFTGVLITKIDWSDAEMVKEKFTFQCRSMTLKYRAQSASGALAPAQMATWQQVSGVSQ